MCQTLQELSIFIVKKRRLLKLLEKVKAEMERRSISYRYCYGGGKSLEGVYAYYDAVRELKSQYQKQIDEVYVACGTGITLTGICCGMQEFFNRQGAWD